MIRFSFHSAPSIWISDIYLRSYIMEKYTLENIEKAAGSNFKKITYTCGFYLFDSFIKIAELQSHRYSTVYRTFINSDLCISTRLSTPDSR